VLTLSTAVLVQVKNFEATVQQSKPKKVIIDAISLLE
jgi:hypothetical protein